MRGRGLCSGPGRRGHSSVAAVFRVRGPLEDPSLVPSPRARAPHDDSLSHRDGHAESRHPSNAKLKKRYYDSPGRP